MASRTNLLFSPLHLFKENLFHHLSLTSPMEILPFQNTFFEDALQWCPLMKPFKDALQRCPSKILHRDALQRCPSKMPLKDATRRCPSKMPLKDDPQRCASKDTLTFQNRCPSKMTLNEALQRCPSKIPLPFSIDSNDLAIKEFKNHSSISRLSNSQGFLFFVISNNCKLYQYQSP